MKLTPAEEANARQVAAQIGADPDTLIAEGEQHKEAGYAQAHQAAAVTVTAMGGAGRSMYGGGPAPNARRRQADGQHP